ncbi:hypothetical protein [Micromonospora sp. RTGN7]|uniref:hypothetical protein n=1 Tax=Micromonospora sp. RTGN7 TaxID=3016526 RepID=UPI0029FEE1FE|nr:hypothetical protein [Micromonospora sp. RTGN7]
MADGTRTIRVRFAGESKGLASATEAGRKVLGRFRDGLTKVDESLSTTSKASGKASDQLQTHLQAVDGRINTVRTRLAELTAQFAETGDIKLFGDMSRSRSLLTNLERVRKEIDASTKQAGRQGGENLRGGFIGGLQRAGAGLAKIGGRIGQGLSSAVSAAGPYVQAAMIAVLASAALAAGPAIAGAIVGGAAGAGIVGGVLLASKDARVAKALDDLKEDAGDALSDAAGRFVPATLDALKQARSSFRGLLPDLRRIFDVSATWLGPLTRSLGAGAEAALSGITTAVTKAGPIVAVIGTSIEHVGRAVGDMFRRLSDNGASMALALKGALMIVEGAIYATGLILNALVETFEFFASKIPGLSGQLEKLKNGQDGAKTSAFNLAGGFQRLATDSTAAAAGIGQVKQKSDELINSNISLARAQIGSRDAVRAATQALKDNANAKLTNKQRSDANMTALLGLADAFNTEADAGDRSGISAGKASAAYATNRQRLIAMAEKAGYSRQRAEELAAQLLKIPKNVNTDVNVDTKSAAGKLETFMKRVRQADGTVAKVTVQVTTKGDHRIPGVGTQVRRWGGIDYAMARGGIAAHFARSPTVLYGERETGGEAFIPRRGDRARSRRIAEVVVRNWLGGDVTWATRRAASTSTRSAGRAEAGIVVENLHVRAYSDRFSLRQVQDDLAMYGVR